MKLKFALPVLGLLLLGSCVSQKKFTALEEEHKRQKTC